MLNPQKQWKHFAAMLLIGDGVMALIRPEWSAEAWTMGPEWWKRSMRWFRDSPALTRAVAVAEITGVLWWALSRESASDVNHPRDSQQAGQQRAA
jgi:hypothetical protein